MQLTRKKWNVIPWAVLSVNGDESVQVSFIVTRIMPSREVWLGLVVESLEFKKLLDGN